MRPTTCAIYVRLSLLTDTSTSPERQRADCQAYAERQGWTVVAEDQDIDVSGTAGSRDKRVGLDRLLALADSYDYLVTWKVDRLARSVVDFHHITTQLASHGAAYVSATEGIDLSTPMGRAMASILATFAELESDNIGQRVRSAQQHLAKLGRWPGGRLPFGWKAEPAPDGPGKVLVVDEAKAELIREAANRLISGGSLWGIAQDFSSRGIASPHDGEQGWTGAALGRILRGRGLLGAIDRQAILSEDVYLDVQRCMERATPGPKPQGRPMLLDGIAVCGLCGYKMHRNHSVREDRSQRERYRCGNRATAPGLKCIGTYVQAEHLEAYVVDQFLRAAGRLSTVMVEPDVEIVDLDADERARLTDALDDLERSRYLRGEWKTDDELRRYEMLRTSLQTGLEGLRKPRSISTSPDATLPVVGEHGTLAAAWEHWSFEDRQAVLRSALEAVSVVRGKARQRAFDAGRVTIEWSHSIDT